MKKWIIFDSDGVLLDTEGAFLEATKIVLAKKNIFFTEQLYKEIYLENGESLLDYHIKDPKELLDTHKDRDIIYNNILLDKDCSFKGIKEFLAELNSRYSLGVVTGSSREFIKKMYEKSQIDKMFEFIISAEDSSNVKPNPEPYKIAHKRYGVPLNNSIVVEDTLRGWRSATLAGFKCIMINSNGNIINHAVGDLVFKNTLDAKDFLISDNW